ncbi:MAG: methyltransferase domain-containing protein [Bdellovibrionales bacterium]
MLETNHSLGPLKVAIPQKSVIDIGCGMNKVPGAYGVDIHPYTGVDQVVDLDKLPWALKDNSFDFLVVRHVVEHVGNLVGFMRELHRISRPGATVYFETPHFSSLNSWNDPTHCRHLSSRWAEGFREGEYLAAQAGTFRIRQSTVTFGKSWRGRMGAFLVKLRGLEKWEKNAAFTYPGLDVVTMLEVVKN